MMKQSSIITDQQMIDRGFLKRKNLGKKRRGVSSLSWFLMGSDFLSIEKYNNEDFFRPTVMISNFKHHFRSIDEIDSFIEFFRIKE